MVGLIMISLFNILKAAQDHEDWKPLNKHTRNVPKKHIYVHRMIDDPDSVKIRSIDQINRYLHSYFNKNQCQDRVEALHVYKRMVRDGKLRHKRGNIRFYNFCKIAEQYYKRSDSKLSLNDLFVMFTEKEDYETIEKVFDNNRSRLEKSFNFRQVRLKYYDWLSDVENIKKKIEIERLNLEIILNAKRSRLKKVNRNL